MRFGVGIIVSTGGVLFMLGQYIHGVLCWVVSILMGYSHDEYIDGVLCCVGVFRIFIGYCVHVVKRKEVVYGRGQHTEWVLCGCE